MDLRETYNFVAEAWHADVVSRPIHRPGVSKVLSLLPAGSRVLDVGCGSGLIAKPFVDAGMSVVGIDLSEGMIEIARRENPAGDFRVLDLRQTDQIKGQFDAVLAVAVLLHLPRQELRATMERLVAKVRPGGLLYVVVKERRDDRPLEGTIAEDHLGVTIHRFFSFYTQEEIESVFRDCGMETVSSEVVPSGRARWIDVVGRKSEA